MTARKPKRFEFDRNVVDAETDISGERVVNIVVDHYDGGPTAVKRLRQLSRWLANAADWLESGYAMKK